MADAAGIVLAGGRSTRMGSPKAALEWHGSTLLRRISGIVGRAVDGPVVVVRAPGQALPALPDGVEVVEDAREGRGPLQGLAAGLAAVRDRAPAAYASSTDVPLLHPRFVRRVLDALADDTDVVLPEVGGYPQPLAAVYRTALADTVERLIAEDRMRPAFLFEACRVKRLDAAALLADPALDAAATLAEAAAATGLALDEHVVAALNGDQITRDPETPLAAGDAIAFLAADAGG
jgi:molybdopterin-guanine dinucleotide biosynthesis protein A